MSLQDYSNYTSLLKKSLQLGYKVTFSYHAEEQMNERGIVSEEVRRVLRSGRVSYVEDDVKYGGLKYSVYKRLDRIEVVCKINKERCFIKVITAYKKP